MSYEKFPDLKIDIADGIATVTINRPEVLNAVNMELHRQLEDVWLDLTYDQRVQAVVLTGAGKAFIAGGDLKRMQERFGTEEGMEHALGVTAKARRLLSSMLDFQKPIIAAVNGDAIGLGATIALFCDIIIASDSAKIGDPHVKIGVSAGDGGAIIWPLLLGPARAKEYLMLGLIATGSEAERIGLVNHAVPAEDVLPTALKTAENLCRLSPWAVRYTKSTVNIMVRHYLNMMMDASMATEALTMLNQDHAEAVTAFVEKRKPVFKKR
jgi:enoyl-CoA hydratase